MTSAEALDAALAALRARLARPARPRLAEALACVTGAPPERVRVALGARAAAPMAFDALWLALATDAGFDDGAAAWAALGARGLVPAAWCADPTRTFVEVSDYAVSGGRAEPSLELAVALAASDDSPARLEALARDAAARLAPWTADRVTTIAWCVASTLPTWAAEDDQVGPWRGIEPALAEAQHYIPGTRGPASEPRLPLWAASAAPSRFVRGRAPSEGLRAAARGLARGLRPRVSRRAHRAAGRAAALTHRARAIRARSSSRRGRVGRRTRRSADRPPRLGGTGEPRGRYRSASARRAAVFRRIVG